MGNVLFMRKGETHAAPLTGVSLADIAEGSIVKINENGSPVEFYVAKHDYESGLNGAGRTLLVRRYPHSDIKWGISGNGNAYAKSNVDSVANGTYKAILDSAVQTAIGTTKFYYTLGDGYTSVSTLSRSVFILSVTELGGSQRSANTEGSALPIASTLRNFKDSSGSLTSQFTRSPLTVTPSSDVWAYYSAQNEWSQINYCTYEFPFRPCFTLPATALFDEETLTFKGVA